MVFLIQRQEAQSKVPLSDPICCFTSDDEEMTHAPTRKCKRPFREINLDFKAGEHESLEDQKRRNSGPPQPRNLHTLQMMQGKEQEPSWDAARFRASVDTDPTVGHHLFDTMCPTAFLAPTLTAKTCFICTQPQNAFFLAQLALQGNRANGKKSLPGRVPGPKTGTKMVPKSGSFQEEFFLLSGQKKSQKLDRALP